MPSDVGKLKRMSGLPVIVKGIQSPEDAKIAMEAGADGIMIHSKHKSGADI